MSQTRRAFLIGGLGTAAAIGLAGWFGRGGQGAPSREEIEDFVHVSRLVTGVDDLPEELAPAYLEALTKLDLQMSPDELGSMARSADTLQELEQSALRQPGARECAGQVAAAWWSGIVPSGHTSEVVGYVDALVWRGMPYARPSSECLGATGAWAKPGKLAA
jgi:hypothetical protein